MNQQIQRLFNIEFPIIQAGMVWCSGWRLAAAVSNAGGLGLIGAGSSTSACGRMILCSMTRFYRGKQP